MIFNPNNTPTGRVLAEHLPDNVDLNWGDRSSKGGLNQLNWKVRDKPTMYEILDENNFPTLPHFTIDRPTIVVDSYVKRAPKYRARYFEEAKIVKRLPAIVIPRVEIDREYRVITYKHKIVATYEKFLEDADRYLRIRNGAKFKIIKHKHTPESFKVLVHQLWLIFEIEIVGLDIAMLGGVPKIIELNSCAGLVNDEGSLSIAGRRLVKRIKREVESWRLTSQQTHTSTMS